MALSTYAELQASIADWLNRNDATSQIQDFIALAESEMSTVLRARQNTALATITIASSGLAALPAGFVAPKTVKLSASPSYDLESVSLDRMTELLASSTQAGSPEAFAIEGDNLRAWPVPSADTSAVLRYYSVIPALSDESTTNWVLTRYPQAYLHGALTQAYLWNGDEDFEERHRALFELAMGRINAVEGMDLYGDSATMLMEATTP